MPQPDGVVIEIMGGGDLDAAGAELGVGVFVGDDGDAPSRQRQFYPFTDQMLVARVLRVYGHGAVPEHGLRAGGGDHQVTGAIGQRIAHIPHVPRLLL